LTARRVLISGEIEQVPTTVLRKEDVIRVNKGGVIPTDGEVIEGVALWTSRPSLASPRP
jgi:potassium-transporting ATPase ATP-binding subunit